MVARCQNCKKNKGPGHVCPQPQPQPQPQPDVDVNGPPPPPPQLRRNNAVGGYINPGQLQHWGHLPVNPPRFRRNKSTKKSFRKSTKKSLRKSTKKSLRKSKPKKSLRKYNRRI